MKAAMIFAGADFVNVRRNFRCHVGRIQLTVWQPKNDSTAIFGIEKGILAIVLNTS
jgi:hypothetical protein